jgi:spermidine synthase
LQPWKTIERVPTPEGILELRRRGDRSFLITIDGRVLMTSDAHRSETALAQLACDAVADRPRPRVLLGGLGMGFTLRAALDRLPPSARATVVDLNPAVVAWCKGPLAFLTKGATADRRVKIIVGDVARLIADAPPASYDAVVLDLYEGPHGANNRVSDPLYCRDALERTAEALTPRGVLAIWSEEADKAFERRLGERFEVTRHRGSRGGRSHLVYLATRQNRRRPSPSRATSS